MTFQDEIDARVARNKAAMRTLGAAIAACLTDFMVDPKSLYESSVTLRHADGRGLGLHNKDGGRIVISMAHDFGHRADVYENGTQLTVDSITVSNTRRPADIAKEIERRFLPAYSAYFPKLKARIAEQAAFDAAREAVIEKLIKLLGGRRSQSSSESIWVPGCFREVRVSSATSIRITLDGSLEEIARVMKPIVDNYGA